MTSERRLWPFGFEIETAGQSLRELAVESLRQLTREHRVLVLRGFGLLERDALSAYCATWGELLAWDFGTVLELKVHDHPENYLFTSGNVPFHWDGAFARAIPHFLFFQCRKAPLPGTGGATLFCDTTAVWKAAPPADQELWKRIAITYSTDKLAHYGGRVTAPLVSRHPVTGDTTLRFAEPPNEATADLNPLFLEIDGVAPGEAPAFLRRLRARLYDTCFCLAHAWRDGDVVIADNHALLHGRNDFRAHSPRQLERVHIL